MEEEQVITDPAAEVIVETPVIVESAPATEVVPATEPPIEARQVAHTTYHVTLPPDPRDNEGKFDEKAGAGGGSGSTTFPRSATSYLGKSRDPKVRMAAAIADAAMSRASSDAGRPSTSSLMKDIIERQTAERKTAESAVQRATATAATKKAESDSHLRSVQRSRESIEVQREMAREPVGGREPPKREPPKRGIGPAEAARALMPGGESWKVKKEQRAAEHRKAATRHTFTAKYHKIKRVGVAGLTLGGTAAAAAGAAAILLEESFKHRPIHAAEFPGKFPDITCASRVTVDADEATPRFKVSPAYNGGPLKVGGYSTPIIVDLAGLSLNAQCIEANLFHEGNQIVGHVESVHNNGRVLSLEGPLSVPGPERDRLVKSYKSRFPWKASIQARPLAKPELIKAGQKVRVNGRDFDGPVLVARKSELYGISFVPRGADDQTSVTIAAQAAHHLGKECNMHKISFEQWLDALGLTSIQAKLDESEKANLRAKYEEAMRAIAAAEEECEEDEEENEDEEEEVPAAASERFDAEPIRAAFDDFLDDIEPVLAKYEDDMPRKEITRIRAEAKKNAKNLKLKAIEGQWTPALLASEFRAAKAGVELELVRTRRPRGPDIVSSPERPTVTGQVILAAMCEAMNYRLEKPEINRDTGREEPHIVATWDDGKLFAPQTLDAAHKVYKGRIGLQQLLLHAAQQNGCRMTEFPKSSYRDVLAYAFNSTPYGSPILAEGESALSLDGILSNYMNKFLLQGFYMVEQVWRSICSVKPVNDFKTSYSYRMSADSIFQKLGPGGEIKIGTLTDETYTNQADTYARGFNLDRRVIVNDDLAAMTQLPVQIGRGSGLALNKMFWTAFLDNSTFFQTSGNAITSLSGAGSALSISGLTAAETAFMQMKDGSGPIGHSPVALLVPPELGATAANLFNTAPAIQLTSDLVPAGNPHAGKYRPVIGRYLSNSSYTGYSTTGWYLLGDPNWISTIEVVFLYGQESPTIESSQADFDSLGIKFRGFHDAGCSKQDHRGAVKSAGV